MAPYIPLVQSGAMSVESFKAKLNGLKDLTKQDLDTFLLRHLEDDFSEVERLPKLGALTKEYFGGSINREATKTEAAGHAQSIMDNMYSGSEFGLAALKHSLQHRGINPSGLPDEMLDVVSQIDMSQAMKLQAYEAFYSGDLLKYRQILDSLKGQIPDKSPQAVTTATAPPTPAHASNTTYSAVTLSVAWEMYVTDKGQNWRRSVTGENQRFYEVLLYVVGDIPVDGITKQHIREALRVAENLPTRTRKPYSSMSLAECIAYDVPEEDLISSQHVHKHLKIWRSLFKTYLVDHKDILITAPTTGISYEVTSNRGGHYSASEMTKLKNTLTDLPATDWRKDYFLTLIYTGARRGEIADIRKHHIRQDEETSRWYIYIEGGKTDHAQRQIPLHQKLALLLSKRCDELSENDLVFGGLPDYTTITNSWVAIMDSLNIPTYDEFGLKRRIHSIRHTFISIAIAAVAKAALVQFVVGHSRTQALGITSRYTHRPTVKELLRVVDSIS
ncbi:tyrosine-type recombinase/integrase [Serratia liquefaciens]|uniref:tyrosine-type recombinase/integrase n=1 Tax=Serratia liquefaciens TaxID=614 RepID=UPI003EC78E31